MHDILLSIPRWIVVGVGLAAQFFFTARTLFQWLASEKSGKVQSPSAYWILSIIGSYLMVFYGLLREDFSIIFGQFISYYVYLWNLDAKGVWKKLSTVLKIALAATPVIAAVLLLRNAAEWFAAFFQRSEVPVWMVIFGSAGQVIFTLRFVYQFLWSRAHGGKSALPVGFWLISLIGSGIIISYGLFRSDVVLILGQSFGFVAYLRNLMIWHKGRKTQHNE